MMVDRTEIGRCFSAARLFALAMTLVIGIAGCDEGPVNYVKITDADLPQQEGTDASTSAGSRAGGRSAAGETLFPMPDEQQAISTIQDAGLPADAVGYGGMRFVETTPAGAGKLSGLSGLENINLAIKDVSDDELAPVALLPTVHGLLVWSPQVSDDGLRHVAGLTDLRYLWLEQAQVTAAGLEHLQGLANLESLNIRFKPLSGGLANLSGMTRLASLNIPGSKLTDQDLAHLSGLTSLESINIGGSPITDAGLEHLAALKNLKSLHLRQTGITDAGLERLASLENLTELNLVLCAGVTDAGVKNLQASLPNCEIRR